MLHCACYRTDYKGFRTTMTADWQRIWHFATTEGVPQRALRIAVVVGTVLNLINQGDALLGAAPVNWLKIGLTYIVPYLVGTYGAVAYRMRAER
jgi:hypothetical protein